MEDICPCCCHSYLCSASARGVVGVPILYKPEEGMCCVQGVAEEQLMLSPK